MSGMPSVFDHGDGVSEVEAVSPLPVVRPFSVNSAGDVSSGDPSQEELHSASSRLGEVHCV